MVFVLSPTSARSESAPGRPRRRNELGKRVLPIIQRPLEGANPPPQLRERNYIFFYADPKAAPGAGFGTGLANLIAALNTDFDWLREHTRYLQRATEWIGGRPRTGCCQATILPRQGLGGAQAQECARAHGPASRFHPRERRGGAGAIERPAQAVRRDGCGPGRARDGAGKGRGCTAQTGEDQKNCVCGGEPFRRYRSVARFARRTIP